MVKNFFFVTKKFFLYVFLDILNLLKHIPRLQFFSNFHWNFQSLVNLVSDVQFQLFINSDLKFQNPMQGGQPPPLHLFYIIKVHFHQNHPYNLIIIRLKSLIWSALKCRQKFNLLFSNQNFSAETSLKPTNIW